MLHLDNEGDGAIFSDDMVYRYVLTRNWSAEGWYAVWLMLNPSTASHELNDPTITRCINFSKALGARGLAVVNLFAYRATNPKELKAVDDPVGPDNDKYIKMLMRKPNSKVILGSGAQTFAKDRFNYILGAYGHVPMFCLNVTKGGFPSHPLYLPKDSKLIPFNHAAERHSDVKRRWHKKGIRRRKSRDHGGHPKAIS